MTKYIKNQLRTVGQTKKVDYSNYTIEELENIIEKNRDPMITEISEEKKPSQFAKAEKDYFSFIKNDFWPIFAIILIVCILLFLNKKKLYKPQAQTSLIKACKSFIARIFQKDKTVETNNSQKDSKKQNKGSGWMFVLVIIIASIFGQIGRQFGKDLFNYSRENSKDVKVGTNEEKKFFMENCIRQYTSNQCEEYYKKIADNISEKIDKEGPSLTEDQLRKESFIDSCSLTGAVSKKDCECMGSYLKTNHPDIFVVDVEKISTIELERAMQKAAEYCIK